jgi:hypothetical protein
MQPLAEARKESFIIADGRLYAAIHAHLDWVLWIRDYPCDAETE